PGQIDKQIELVKKLEIQGKKVTIPETLEGNPGENGESAPDDKTIKKAKREARKKAREEAKENGKEKRDK
ncbi:MAG: hypothetical protein VX035_10355, partial [Planctomycetota bacterium]|nr:hypothetical protein [Planctomycetota bacterium]